MNEQNDSNMSGKTTIDYIESKIDNIGRDVREMKILLQGNTFDKSDTGMIGEVADLRKRVSNLERVKERGVYLLVGLAFGAGWGLSDFITKLL